MYRWMGSHVYDWIGLRGFSTEFRGGGGGGANCRELGDKKILPSGIQKWKDSREKRLLQKEL